MVPSILRSFKVCLLRFFKEGLGLRMDLLEVMGNLFTVPKVFRGRKPPFPLGDREPDPLVPSIRKGDEFPLAQSKEYIGADLADLPFPFGDPGIGVKGILFSGHGPKGPFYPFKELFVVEGGTGIVDLSKELVGEVGKNGATALFPVHHIVLCLVLHHIYCGDVIAAEGGGYPMHVEQTNGRCFLHQ